MLATPETKAPIFLASFFCFLYSSRLSLTFSGPVFIEIMRSDLFSGKIFWSGLSAEH